MLRLIGVLPLLALIYLFGCDCPECLSQRAMEDTMRYIDEHGPGSGINEIPNPPAPD